VVLGGQDALKRISEKGERDKKESDRSALRKVRSRGGRNGGGGRKVKDSGRLLVESVARCQKGGEERWEHC